MVDPLYRLLHLFLGDVCQIHALGLQPPWQVQKIIFAPNESGREELHLVIGFPPGSRFADESGTACPVHDTVEQRWQHLTRRPDPLRRAAHQDPRRPGGLTVAVPWARPGSGFTLLFEALALIEREMPVSRVAELMRVNPKRTWTVFTHSINSNVFFAWVTQDLLPKLPVGAVVVMGNASFHKRSDIQQAILEAGRVEIFAAILAGFEPYRVQVGAVVSR